MSPLGGRASTSQRPASEEKSGQVTTAKFLRMLGNEKMGDRVGFWETPPIPNAQSICGSRSESQSARTDWRRAPSTRWEPQSTHQKAGSECSAIFFDLMQVVCSSKMKGNSDRCDRRYRGANSPRQIEGRRSEQEGCAALAVQPVCQIFEPPKLGQGYAQLEQAMLMKG